MVAFSWLCWLFWIVFDCVLFWLVLVVASSVWFWLGVFGCVVLVRPNCYWLCWLWPDYEWLCLAELVGLGCAVLVVAGLCLAWRPPASMKAAAWPATAFLHSRAAAQPPPQLPSQLCCTTTKTASTQELLNCTAADNWDHNCRSCHRRICIQVTTKHHNTTDGAHIVHTARLHTPQLQKLVVDSGCNNPHNCKQ